MDLENSSGIFINIRPWKVTTGKQQDQSGKTINSGGIWYLFTTYAKMKEGKMVKMKIIPFIF